MKKTFEAVRRFWPLIPVGIFLWIFFFVYRPFEPHCKCLPLSFWANGVYSPYGNTNYHNALNDLKVAAIRQIGTNALPYALKFCSKKGSNTRMAITRWLVEHGSSKPEFGDFSYHEPRFFGIKIPVPQDTRDKGYGIVAALGPLAKSVIPDLIRLLGDTDTGVSTTASWCLEAIGPDAIPQLTVALNSENQKQRFMACFSLRHMIDTTGNLQSAMYPVIPVLVRQLNDGDGVMRAEAAKALGKYPVDAPTVVPALIGALKRETNDNLPNTIFWIGNYTCALASYHSNAIAAVPILTNFIQAGKNGRPQNALSALRMIAPEIAEGYIVKFNQALTNPPPDSSVSNLYYNFYGPGNVANVTTKMESAISAEQN